MALGGKTSWTKPSIDVSLLTPLLKMGKQNKSCLAKQKTCNIMYPKNHWILRFWGVWMCIAGVLDHQTTSFEIPWFLGYIYQMYHAYIHECMHIFTSYLLFPKFRDFSSKRFPHSSTAIERRTYLPSLKWPVDFWLNMILNQQCNVSH